MHERLYKALCEYGKDIPNKWLKQALIFKESAIVLSDTFDYRKSMPAFMGVGIKTPSFILSAFSCELFIKGMLKAEKIPNKHNLKTLFCTLNGKTQNAITEKVCTKMNVRKKAETEAHYQEMIKSVNENSASSPEEKAEMIRQRTEQQKMALDENATQTVVRQNKLVSTIDQLLYHSQNVELNDYDKKCRDATLQCREMLNKTETVIEKVWFGRDEFFSELDKHKNAFTDFRYAHQTGTKTYSPNFMERLQEAILEFCEENEIFDNINPDF